jgi:phosphocarrier protein HPr
MNDKPPTDIVPPDGLNHDKAPFRRTVTICNRRGLHARAAARFVKLADQFDAEIVVAKNGASVSGRSIMGLMMLAAGPGTSIELRGSGAEAERAIDALAALICGGFDED